MFSEPKLEKRAAQPYAGIRTTATLAELGAGLIPRLHGEVYRWLEQHGGAPDGPPFIRYHLIDMANTLDLTLGVPVASPVAGDARVGADALPAGRYATLIYTGIENGVAGNKALLDWGAEQKLEWDTRATPDGDVFGSRYEQFLTDPDDEPDMAKWQTEVAIRLAE